MYETSPTWEHDSNWNIKASSLQGRPGRGCCCCLIHCTLTCFLTKSFRGASGFLRKREACWRMPVFLSASLFSPSVSVSLLPTHPPSLSLILYKLWELLKAHRDEKVCIVGAACAKAFAQQINACLSLRSDKSQMFVSFSCLIDTQVFLLKGRGEEKRSERKWGKSFRCYLSGQSLVWGWSGSQERDQRAEPAAEQPSTVWQVSNWISTKWKYHQKQTVPQWIRPNSLLTL